MKKMNLRLSAFLAAIVLTVPTTALAQTNKDLNVDLGDRTVNVEAVAEENGVDPYALKEAIEEGLATGKTSPFSNLKVEDPGPAPTVTESLTRASTVKVERWNEDATAYTALGGALTASGKTPQVGMCAMHINVTSQTENSTRDRLKLGKPLYLTAPVWVQGRALNTLILEDRGQPTNRTRFWVDIYFGYQDSYNLNAAINYGVQKVSYHYWVQ